jgi:hypothetical protein
MTVSLPIADSPPYAPTPLAVPSDSRLPATYESVPLDEARWEAWRAKGRRADREFAEKMRSLALIGGVVASALGMYWIGFD